MKCNHEVTKKTKHTKYLFPQEEKNFVVKEGN